MPETTSPIFSVAAPAKINLYLHVVGRRVDGYHLLDSLVTFADVGDVVELRAANDFSFAVAGPFAAMLSDTAAENLAVRAARAVAAAINKPLNFALRLVKNLPVAAGLGGGSADAAATVRACLKWWNVSPAAVPDLDQLLLSLGADVPVCFYGAPARMQGIGEIVQAAPPLPTLAAVLVNPGVPCSTAAVYRQLKLPDQPRVMHMPHAFVNAAALVEFLRVHDNMLTAAACAVEPVIATVLSALQKQADCLLARLCGSGPTCFGIFSDTQTAKRAASELAAQFPRGWVQTVTLNS